ncbi:MAG TPA: hypothetical protein PLJ93_02245 [Candidatus Mcinerneyibacteriales bacterium]|nr:hypothetical protein [Candidatus Mcinerneyibacteriales bacterium]
MYKTKYDGELPGMTGEGLDAVKGIVEDIKRSGVFQFEKVNLDELKTVFASDVQGTQYQEMSGGGYELTVFAKDRYPYKYVLNQEKITIVDPEKALVEILGQLDGMKKDIQGEAERFKLVQENIPKIDINLKELAAQEESLKLIDKVYEDFVAAETAAEINQKEYDQARELLQGLAYRLDEIKSVKSVSSEVIQNLGKYYFDTEDYKTRLTNMASYLKAGKLRGMANGLISDADSIMSDIDNDIEKFSPKAQEMAETVDSRQEEIDKWDGLLLDYKNKMQYVVQKFVDLKKAS